MVKVCVPKEHEDTKTRTLPYGTGKRGGYKGEMNNTERFSSGIYL